MGILEKLCPVLWKYGECDEKYTIRILIMFKSKLISVKALLVFTSACLFSMASSAGPIVSFDWNDGTLQGWSKQSPFCGDLGVDPSFGNAGGSIFATDTRSGCGGLLAIAPGLSGDLSGYSHIEWDEYVPNRSTTVISSFIRLVSTDGTVFQSDRTLGSTNSWAAKSVSLNDASGWIRSLGSSSFEDVLASVDSLEISMDTSTSASGGVESWIDNFNVFADAVDVNEPAGLSLFFMSLMMLIYPRIRRK